LRESRAKSLRKIRYVRKSVSGLKVTSRGQSVARCPLGRFPYGLATSEAVQVGVARLGPATPRARSPSCRATRSRPLQVRRARDFDCSPRHSARNAPSDSLAAAPPPNSRLLPFCRSALPVKNLDRATWLGWEAGLSPLATPHPPKVAHFSQFADPSRGRFGFLALAFGLRRK
jgi:hypothetical protein